MIPESFQDRKARFERGSARKAAALPHIILALPVEPPVKRHENGLRPIEIAPGVGEPAEQDEANCGVIGFAPLKRKALRSALDLC